MELLFGAVFLLCCASWTLRANEHIRIDIVNSSLSKKTARSVIEADPGHVFFPLPMVAVFSTPACRS